MGKRKIDNSKKESDIPLLKIFDFFSWGTQKKKNENTS